MLKNISCCYNNTRARAENGAIRMTACTTNLKFEFFPVKSINFLLN